MTCPSCGDIYNQTYRPRIPGDRHHPEEPAGYECNRCGEWYPEDRSVYDDYAYEDLKNRLIEQGPRK